MNRLPLSRGIEEPGVNRPSRECGGEVRGAADPPAPPGRWWRTAASRAPGAWSSHAAAATAPGTQSSLLSQGLQKKKIIIKQKIQ